MFLVQLTWEEPNQDLQTEQEGKRSSLLLKRDVMNHSAPASAATGPGERKGDERATEERSKTWYMQEMNKSLLRREGQMVCQRRGWVRRRGSQTQQMFGSGRLAFSCSGYNECASILKPSMPPGRDGCAHHSPGLQSLCEFGATTPDPVS
ncbi:hypothetical protein INR49_014053 [Caranx melampygus]|nr:hypothetical protein INR49_014053 [Caranx melampygus]